MSEIIPKDIKERLNKLSLDSDVDINIINNAYSVILKQVSPSTPNRYESVLQITILQLREYVKRLPKKPIEQTKPIQKQVKVEKDKHTPAQVKRAEEIFVSLIGQRRNG